MLRKALWDLRWTTSWFAVGAAGYVVLVSLFYPAFRSQMQAIQQLLVHYPKALLTALGYTDMTSFTGFLGAEALNLFWPLIVLIFATLAGASLVAKEVEDGTSEIWLSVPPSRRTLLLGKMAALALGLLGAVAVGVAGVEISAVLVGATLKPMGLLAMGVVMITFLLVVAGYSGLLSSWLSSRGAAAGVSFGITVASYVAWLVAGLSDQWSQLKDVSIFTAYTPQKALETGTVDMTAIGILLAVTVVCVVLALVGFGRRDAI